MNNGCLILHGLTGTPATMESFHKVFLNAGFRISAPCLAGHGGTLDDLARVSWREWYETIRISYSILRKECERVFCAGASLGALLCLKLALDEGWGVSGIAVIGTPLRLSLPKRIAMTIVRRSPLKGAIRSIPKDIKKSVADPEGRMKYQQMSLPRIPMNAIFELSDLQDEVLKSLNKVTSPLLIMHGSDDMVAPIFNVEMLKNSVSSSIVETMIFNGCRHVLTMDYEKVKVAKTALYFFRRFSR